MRRVWTQGDGTERLRRPCRAQGAELGMLYETGSGVRYDDNDNGDSDDEDDDDNDDNDDNNDGDDEGDGNKHNGIRLGEYVAVQEPGK